MPCWRRRAWLLPKVGKRAPKDLILTVDADTEAGAEAALATARQLLVERQQAVETSAAAPTSDARLGPENLAQCQSRRDLRPRRLRHVRGHARPEARAPRLSFQRQRPGSGRGRTEAGGRESRTALHGSGLRNGLSERDRHRFLQRCPERKDRLRRSLRDRAAGGSLAHRDARRGRFPRHRRRGARSVGGGGRPHDTLRLGRARGRPGNRGDRVDLQASACDRAASGRGGHGRRSPNPLSPASSAQRRPRTARPSGSTPWMPRPTPLSPAWPNGPGPLGPSRIPMRSAGARIGFSRKGRWPAARSSASTPVARSRTRRTCCSLDCMCTQPRTAFLISATTNTPSGRPHPMIDPQTRIDMIAESRRIPRVRRPPAGPRAGTRLACEPGRTPGCRRTRGAVPCRAAGRRLVAVASIVGTDSDPQGLARATRSA